MGELPWIANALTAPRVSEAPILDGDLGDAAWARAPVMRVETDWRGARAGPETLVRAVWTPEAIHFAFDCAYETLVVDDGAPTDTEHPALHRFDAVEAFIDHTPRSRATYREYEIGPRGHFMDIDVNRDRRPRGDVEWASGLTVATAVDEATRRFTIEVRIPAAAFDRPALRPADYKLALYRVSGPSQARVHQARFPTFTERPNFHVPERFGWIRLTGR
jgi:hypothetical protein